MNEHIPIGVLMLAIYECSVSTLSCLSQSDISSEYVWVGKFQSKFYFPIDLEFLLGLGHINIIAHLNLELYSMLDTWANWFLDL